MKHVYVRIELDDTDEASQSLGEIAAAISVRKSAGVVSSTIMNPIQAINAAKRDIPGWADLWLSK